MEPAQNKLNEFASRIADRMHQPSAALAAQAGGVGAPDRPLQTSFTNNPWLKVVAIVLVVMFPFVTYAVGRRAAGQEGTSPEAPLALAPSEQDQGPSGPVEGGPAVGTEPSPSPTPSEEPAPEASPSLADKLDAEAETKAKAPTAPLSRCSDGKDNDGDGRKDFPADKGCSSTSDTTESSESAAAESTARPATARVAAAVPAAAPAPAPAPPAPTVHHVACATSIRIVVAEGKLAEQSEQTCSDGSRKLVGPPALKAHCEDGIDNDSDGKIDRNDPGCDSLSDNSEADPAPPAPKAQCEDGVDNDGDGTTDMMDTGCSSATDPTEADPAPQLTDCSDGLDNDGDGLVDTHDPGCGTQGAILETPFNVQCSDGLDNDGDGFIDLADPQCSDSQDTSELPADPACKDGQDNDGDTLIDLADPQCANNPNQQSEA